MKKVSLAALICSLFFACKNEPERILIKLNKGQQYEQHLLLKSTITQTISGKKRSTSTTSTGVNLYEVLAVQDSIYTFQVTYKSMKVQIEADGSPAAQTTNPAMFVLEKLKGQAYQMKISNTGRIVAVTGADSLFSRVAGSLSGLNEEMKQSLIKSFITAYGDSAIKSGSLQYANVYPQQAVKEGDSWNVHRPGGGNMLSPKVDAVYKVDQISSREYLIGMQSKLSLGTAAKDSPVFGLTMSGTMDSRNKIDRETGLLVESKIKQQMTGYAKILTSTSAMVGDSILMDIKGETTLTNTLIK